MKNGTAVTVNGNKAQAVALSPKTERLFARALKGLTRGNEAGVITIDDIKKEMPGVDVEEILGFMEIVPRTMNGMGFIAGRRNHPHRIVFGPALEAWEHSEAIRAEWRKKNNKTPSGAERTNGRGPGRPKGSVNKVPPITALVKRGRPVGSVRPQVAIANAEELANFGIKIEVGDLRVGKQEAVLPLTVKVLV